MLRESTLFRSGTYIAVPNNLPDRVLEEGVGAALLIGSAKMHDRSGINNKSTPRSLPTALSVLCSVQEASTSFVCIYQTHSIFCRYPVAAMAPKIAIVFVRQPHPPHFYHSPPPPPPPPPGRQQIIFEK